jgi:heptosyltransferase II
MLKPSRKVLIVKTGYSEFLDRGISTTVSLGDVLICTSLLHLYKNDHVTWLTSWEARELLQDNPLIHELLIFETSTLPKLLNQSFDIVVNLEKDIGISMFLNHIKTSQSFGFYFDDTTHTIETRNPATQYLLNGQEHHKNIYKSALEILYETVDAKWEGQGLVLNNKPSPSGTQFDIGFNHAVGSKWPTKAWPMSHWKKLEELLNGRFTISWQQGHKNLQRYIEWINSCRIIVSSDSLGQAIGLALGKNVITLYGPTNFRRMQGIEKVTVVPSTMDCPHMPCFLPYCKLGTSCMEHIQPEDIAALCEKQLVGVHG